MTMTRSISPRLRRLLPAAVVLVTVSCGTTAPGTTASSTSAVPATGPATPATTEPAPAAATAAPAASAAPGARASRPPGAAAVIYGVILARPVCPVDPVYHACRPRPLGGVEVQARSPGAGVAGVMASARTGSNGHYSLQLRPGRYLLVAVPPQLLPRCPGVIVSVGSGAAIRADINCGTGLRPLPGA
jgi:hypothetical protein